MKISISTAISFLFITFCTILFVNMMNLAIAIQKVNDYHYATVHEIESSDFSPYVISQRQSNGTYSTSIVQKTSKEDLRIYEVTTTATIKLPIINYTTTYAKESIAR